MTPQNQRRRLFIDRPIQGAMLIRAVSYWAVSVMVQLLIVSLFVLVTSYANDWNTSGARLWWHVQLSLVAALAILPMILVDVLKLSHRWVGPIFRLRATLQALNRGEPAPPIRFREKDYWQELADEINVLSEELNRYRVNSRRDEGSGAPRDLTAHDDSCGLQQVTEPVAPAPITVSMDTGTGSDVKPVVPISPGWPAFPTSAR